MATHRWALQPSWPFQRQKAGEGDNKSFEISQRFQAIVRWFGWWQSFLVVFEWFCSIKFEISRKKKKRKRSGLEQGPHTHTHTHTQNLQFIMILFFFCFFLFAEKNMLHGFQSAYLLYLNRKDALRRDSLVYVPRKHLGVDSMWSRWIFEGFFFFLTFIFIWNGGKKKKKTKRKNRDFFFWPGLRTPKIFFSGFYTKSYVTKHQRSNFF